MPPVLMENKKLAESEAAQENVAYEYLCHLQEAKIWIESILKENLPPALELEESLRNGVYLARLGNIIAPEVVPLSRIYDIFQHRYRSFGLQFKHTDNINYWIKALNATGFPKIFHPETSDIYEKKNMPKLIYCIHALSTHLFKLGKTPSIQALYGKLNFSTKDIKTTCDLLMKHNGKIPSFRKINDVMSDESDCDQSIILSNTLKIDEAIKRESHESLLDCLQNPETELVHVMPQNITEYMLALKKAKMLKCESAHNRSLRNGSMPDIHDQILTQHEIQGYIRSTNCDCLWKNIDNCIKEKDKEQLQELMPKLSSLDLIDFKESNLGSYIEILLKMDYEKLQIFAKNHTPREIIQNVIRNGNRAFQDRTRDGSTVRKSYIEQDKSGVEMKSALSPLLITNSTTSPYSDESKKPQTFPYEFQIEKIIKIQALWRGYLARKLLKELVFESNCSKFVLLRRMAILCKITSPNYAEQLKLQAMRSSVVETIKRNQDLAVSLDETDTKIGLLVHNRMSIQSLDLEKKKPENNCNGFRSKGIKTFNKETKTILDGYRQLFYMLQTDPSYLTRLIIRLPPKSTHVIQSCIFSLFNYGSSSRDAYLLLKLIRTALVEEVKCKFQKPIDAVRGNPLVLRLALCFSRQYEGYNPLRKILGFLIESVLNEKTYIDTNPVDIYRRWINKMEMETGQKAYYPNCVTREEALAHPEVAEQLQHNLKLLKMWVRTFLKRITACAEEFPYALRFIAKTLWKALKERFPEASEKDIIKIVGNLVFYQYINTAIVAPDTFYIISLPPDKHLRPEQRRNLASIAKILQFAASKKGFGEESKHLMSMNSFIITCHEEMKAFCKKCCTVQDLEEHFNVTKYSEAALIEKPKIYITLEEICECHQILFAERQIVSPDPFDPIQEVLDVLGEPRSIAGLLGCSLDEAVTSRAGRTQITLELDNKYQLPPEDPTDGEKLFIETKEMIMKRIHGLEGNSLKSAVDTDQHSDIASNLMQLELMGLVRNSDDYDIMIESLIADITQKQKCRENLTKEMKILSVALQRLEEKKKYYEDQLSYYEKYLNACLSSLTKSKTRHLRVIKYTANALIERGIVISLEGVPASQLKNVQFEIGATECNGVYSVKGRFMGVEVEKINLDVQDLLKHQFEGQPIMDLFGKAKINVNLLLHLLNKKFHSR